MKISFSISLMLFALILFTSCEESSILPDQNSSQFAGKGGNSGGNKEKKIKSPDDSTPLEPTPTEFTGTTYQVTTDISHALYQFIINEEQQQILLRATEEFGQWGVDYYGYWAEPFPFADQQVYNKSGLSETTFNFEFLSPTSVHVTLHVIVRSEFSYDTITRDEIIDIGIFDVVN